MKNLKNLTLLMGLFSFLILFSSCSKEEELPTPITQSLKIKVQLAGSTGYLQNVSTGISNTKDDLDNGIYLQTQMTDANGVADFGVVNPQTYYYAAAYELGEDLYYGTGSIQVTSGQDLELTLILNP